MRRDATSDGRTDDGPATEANQAAMSRRNMLLSGTPRTPRPYIPTRAPPPYIPTRGA